MPFSKLVSSDLDSFVAMDELKLTLSAPESCKDGNTLISVYKSLQGPGWCSEM